jgi:putative transposase
VRYDWPAHYLFDTIEDMQEFATRWLWTYNHERPNMAIGSMTPNKNWPWPLNLHSQVASKMGHYHFFQE